MLDVVAGLGVSLLSPCRPCPCPCACACACARQPSDFSATAGDGESGDFGKQRRLQGRCRTAGACFAGCGAQPHGAWHAGFDVHQQSTQCILWDGLPILCRELMAPLPLRHTKLPRGKRLLHKKPQSPPPRPPCSARAREQCLFHRPSAPGGGGLAWGGMPRPAPRSPSKIPGAPEPGSYRCAASANGTNHNKDRSRQAATGQCRRRESRKYRSGQSKR